MPMNSPIENDSALGLPPEPPPLITWPCYEPAGHRVEVTQADLLQHVLIIGATGSGKTTLLASALQQLIAHEAGDPSQRPGLLILDSKNELVELVRAAARAAGREPEVITLGPDGNAQFDLFGDLRALEDVNTVTRRMMLATPPLGGENAYWQTATTSMVAAGLSLLVATQPRVTFDFALHFLRTWFMGTRTIPKLLQDLVAKAKKQIEGAQTGSRAGQNHQLQGALDHVELWSQLDPRTRSNLQSCLLKRAAAPHEQRRRHVLRTARAASVRPGLGGAQRSAMRRINQRSDSAGAGQVPFPPDTTGVLRFRPAPDRHPSPPLRACG